LGYPGPRGGSRAFCDRMNGWAQAEGSRASVTFSGATARRGGRPDRPQPGPERTEAIRAELNLGVGDAAFFVGGEPKTFYKFAGLARTKVATETGPDSPGPV